MGVVLGSREILGGFEDFLDLEANSRFFVAQRNLEAISRIWPESVPGFGVLSAGAGSGIYQYPQRSWASMNF